MTDRMVDSHHKREWKWGVCVSKVMHNTKKERDEIFTWKPLTGKNHWEEENPLQSVNLQELHGLFGVSLNKGLTVEILG